MNIDDFLTRFDEFQDTDVSVVEAKLAEAALELDTDTWGALWSPAAPVLSLADTAHGYLTAHKLAMSPSGQNARLIPQDGVTTYLRHFNDLVKKTVPGAYVAGMLNPTGWCP